MKDLTVWDLQARFSVSRPPLAAYRTETGRINVMPYNRHGALVLPSYAKYLGSVIGLCMKHARNLAKAKWHDTLSPHEETR